MLATMCPYIVCASLAVMLTFWIVTELLDFILIKIEFHSRPLSVGSHAKKERGYPIRVLISIVPSYTTYPLCGARIPLKIFARLVTYAMARCYAESGDRTSYIKWGIVWHTSGFH